MLKMDQNVNIVVKTNLIIHAEPKTCLTYERNIKDIQKKDRKEHSDLEDTFYNCLKIGLHYSSEKLFLSYI